MRLPFSAELVEKIAYPVCILSIVVFVPASVAGIWVELESELFWKIVGSSGLLVFASALALSATRAVKDPRR